MGQDHPLLGLPPAQPRAHADHERAHLRNGRQLPAGRGGHRGPQPHRVRPHQAAGALQDHPVAAQVADSLRELLPRQDGLPGGVHRGARGGAARGRRGGQHQELHVQVPPRRQRHLRRQLHLLPPRLRHLRHRRLRRHVQLLGQGLQAAAQGSEQVPVRAAARTHPLRGVQPRRLAVRVRRVVRLVARLLRVQPAGDEEHHPDPRGEGGRGQGQAQGGHGGGRQEVGA
mmetsp:Transcript_21674/g.55192  ORF Transcript_21674/g.55192 Transcript_21674/m.55192 type:complete len:228 (-) Transcript_21674:482-1165(-)